MEELKKNLDLLNNDYATIRIYWKFFDDKRMTDPSQDAKYPK
jgi:hypothetical protein